MRESAGRKLGAFLFLVIIFIEVFIQCIENLPETLRVYLPIECALISLRFWES